MRITSRVLAFLSILAVGLSAPQVEAGLFGPCGCLGRCCRDCRYTTTICCRQYNAFTPCCFGSVMCNGCCPLMCTPPGCFGLPSMGGWPQGPYCGSMGCGPMACGPTCDDSCAGGIPGTPPPISTLPPSQSMPQGPVGPAPAPSFTPPLPTPLNNTTFNGYRPMTPNYRPMPSYGLQQTTYYGNYYPSYYPSYNYGSAGYNMGYGPTPMGTAPGYWYGR